ncbi:MAG: serine hydrolase [Verrucomicrobia bacterium]|nr:serine hydrolase [Verrucomicrobiota bacterium]
MKIALLVTFIATIAAGAIAAETGTTVTQEKVQNAIPQLEKLIADTMQKTGVPGLAVGIVYKDQIVYLKAFGVREEGKPDPVDPDTVFQLASLSKPIASTVAAIVVGRGLADWDDQIVQHDPGFQMYIPWVTYEITIRDFLCHRSGLPTSSGDLLEDLGGNREQALFSLRYQRPTSSFRSAYAYSNFGYTEGATAIAKAAGKSWEDLSAELLYSPLGMTSTSSRFSDYITRTNRAKPHVLVDGKWVAKYQREPDAQAPAGGVSSNVRDLMQWTRLQLNDGKLGDQKIVDGKALAETHRPQIVMRQAEDPARDRAGFYGLGWDISYDYNGLVFWAHSGAFDLGAATNVNLLPSESLGIVILTNTSPIGVPESLTKSFFDMVLTGKVQRDWLELYGKGFAEITAPNYGTEVDYTHPPEKATPALPAAAYIGTYHNDMYGDLVIAEKDSGLTMTLGPKKMMFPLQHFDRDIFTYQPVGENAYGLSGVMFNLGPKQKATSVMLENLMVTDEGTFSRNAEY